MNLCTNGIQAMRTGGRLTVGLEALDTTTDRAPSHGVLQAGHHLRLWVSDAGCGIPAQVLPRIFEPFLTTQDPGAGTGLGLVLVQGIVADLGGTLNRLRSRCTGPAYQLARGLQAVTEVPRADIIRQPGRPTVASMPTAASAGVPPTRASARTEPSTLPRRAKTYPIRGRSRVRTSRPPAG